MGGQGERGDSRDVWLVHRARQQCERFHRHCHACRFGDERVRDARDDGQGMSVTICVVLRSYGGENDKGRPAWFSKDLVLASFLRAVETARAADVDIMPVFANDGPIPSPRDEVMARSGRVEHTTDGPVGLLDSYRFALDLPGRLGLVGSDVICFVEDDYLLTSDAFVLLARAAEELPQATYFALMGSRPTDPDDPEQRLRHGTPQVWHPQPDLQAGGVTWINIMSTTSTFAARVGALAADREIHELSMRPFRKRFLDHELCLMYQGVTPYRGREYFFGLPGDFVPGLRGVLRAIALLPFRFDVNRRARAQRVPHYLYAVSPQQAAHLEDGQLPEGRDWDAEAAGVAAWAREHDVPVAGAPASDA